MTDTAARLFLNLVEALNAVCQRHSGQVALQNLDAGNDFATVFLRIIALGDETQNELCKVPFSSEERREDMMGRVLTSQRALLNALATRGAGGTTGPLLSEAQIERLRSVVEQIEEKGVSNGPMPDRDEMMRATEALIAEVKGWDIDEYAKKTLLIQLNSIEQVIQRADFYSSTELRAKVKGVIADFAAEFFAHDKEYQTKMERLVSWARTGFFPASTLMLGLTADVSAVVALLPGPS